MVRWEKWIPSSALVFFSLLTTGLIGCDLSDNTIQGSINGENGQQKISLVYSTLTVGNNALVEGQETTVYLQVKNENNTALEQGDLEIAFNILSGTGNAKGVLSNQQYEGSGVYSIKFLATEAGTAVEVEGRINGQALASMVPQISVTAAALKFTGVSSPSTPANNRVFDEIDGGWTLSGECDDVLGDVTISGGLDSDVAATCSGGVFSATLNHSTTSTSPYFTGSEIQIQQGLAKTKTYLYETNSASPPVFVSNATELASIGLEDDTIYILVDNIDIAATFGPDSNWTPLGDDIFTNAFTGTLEGDGKTISNLHINGGFSQPTGLFGAASNADIRNLHLENFSITSTYGSVGALIGASSGAGVISNVTANVNISGPSTVGGLVGHSRISIRNCSTAGSVTAASGYVGGLVGAHDDDLLDSSSSADVTLTGTGAYVGGLVGRLENSKPAYGLWATGIVTSPSDSIFVGGLVGWADRSFTDSFSTGNVSGGSNVGGLVGWLNGVLIYRTYSLGGVSASSSAAGPITGSNTALPDSYYSESSLCSGCDNSNGLSITADDFKSQSTFSGWDFTNVWQIDEGVSPPTLR